MLNNTVIAKIKQFANSITLKKYLNKRFNNVYKYFNNLFK